MTQKNPKDPFDPIEYPSETSQCEHGVTREADCFMCQEEGKAKAQKEADEKAKKEREDAESGI